MLTRRSEAEAGIGNGTLLIRVGALADDRHGQPHREVSRPMLQHAMQHTKYNRRLATCNMLRCMLHTTCNCRAACSTVNCNVPT